MAKPGITLVQFIERAEAPEWFWWLLLIVLIAT